MGGIYHLRIEHLKYFLMIATQQSISKAAEQLYISQPALSESLRNLEKEVGVPLAIRSRHGVTLTEEGKEFAQFAAEIYQTYTNMQMHFQQKYKPTLEQQVIHLITTPMCAHTYVYQLIASFKQLYPNIEVLYLEVPDDKFFCYLQENANLFAFILLYPESLPKKLPSSIERIMLGETPLVACFASKHLFAFRSAISLAELDQVSLITFESSFSVRGFLEDENKIVSNSVEMHLQAITKENYAGIVPFLSYQHLFAEHNIQAVPIEPTEMIQNCVFHPTWNTMSETEKLFLQYIKSYFLQ